MRELLTLAIHVLVTCAKLLRPGGVRAVAAESLLLKHQLLISNRSRQPAPNLTSADRFVLGLTTPACALSSSSMMRVSNIDAPPGPDSAMGERSEYGDEADVVPLFDGSFELD